MDCSKVEKLIRSLCMEKRLIQKQLADAMNISDNFEPFHTRLAKRIHRISAAAMASSRQKERHLRTHTSFPAFRDSHSAASPCTTTALKTTAEF